MEEIEGSQNSKNVSTTTYLLLANEKARYDHLDCLKLSYNALLSKLDNFIILSMTVGVDLSKQLSLFLTTPFLSAD